VSHPSNGKLRLIELSKNKIGGFKTFSSQHMIL